MLGVLRKREGVRMNVRHLRAGHGTDMDADARRRAGSELSGHAGCGGSHGHDGADAEPDLMLGFHAGFLPRRRSDSVKTATHNKACGSK